MTFSGIIALFGTLLVLAAVPSLSVLAVSARAVGSGFIHGVFTAVGIVVGDIIFILIAILGLAVLADTMGRSFVLVKYLGCVYLIALGVGLLRSAEHTGAADSVAENSLLSSFLMGLFITLGDQKAILFYLGVFPAFVDLSALTFLDTATIVSVATVAVGGVKVGYAAIANKTRLLTGAKTVRVINLAAGGLVIAVGVFTLLEA